MYISNVSLYTKGLKKTSWNNVVKESNNVSNFRLNEGHVKQKAIKKLFSNNELVDVLEALSKV
ncbi:hypothetical protein CRI87_09885 [Liquorilactobacillus satsumensis]|nr:hypothetical protein [Liquorilactobacillus satsumensis]